MYFNVGTMYDSEKTIESFDKNSQTVIINNNKRGNFLSNPVTTASF